MENINLDNLLMHITAELEKMQKETRRFSLRKVFQSRLNLNKNVLVGVVGDTGEGKSYLSISICESMYDKFGLRNISLTVSQFMWNLVNAQKAFTFDDAAARINARKWKDDLNMLVSEAAQTQRFLNQVVVYNMPSLGFLDYQVRQLLHFAIFKKDQKTAYVYRVSVDRLRGKVYFKRIAKMYEIPLPKNMELVEKYEAKKAAFMKARYQQMYLEARKLEEGEISQEQLIKTIKENIDLVKNNKGELSTSKIAALLDISMHKARKIKNIILLEKEKKRRVINVAV